MAEPLKVPGILLFRHGNKADMPQLFEGEGGYAADTRELFVGTGGGNVNMSGSHWYRGAAMSGTSAATGAYSYSACPEVKIDDIYMNTSNGNIYACTTPGKGTAAKWTYQGSIKGASGAPGTDLQAVYSTTPVKIGTWIDGSEVYRAAWEFTNAEFKAAGSVMDITDIPNVPSLGNYKTVIKENYAVTPYADNITNATSYTELRTAMQANASADDSFKTYCVIEYIV